MKSCQIRTWLCCLIYLSILVIPTTSFSKDTNTTFSNREFQTLLTSVKRKVEQEKQNYANSIHKKEDLLNKNHVKKKLDFLAKIDQIVRNDLIAPVMAREHLYDKNSKYNIAAQYMQEVDAFTIKNLEQILSIHYWITKSGFGKKAALDAWLILHHAQDNLLKYKVLFILEHLIKQKAAEPDSYALLYDGLATELTDSKFNIKQRYGTQFKPTKTGDFELYPYEGTLQDLNERRLEIGLDTIESYIERFTSSCNCKVDL